MVLALGPTPELIRDRQVDHQLCACGYVAAAGHGQLQSPHPDGLVRGAQVVCEAPFMVPPRPPPGALNHGWLPRPQGCAWGGCHKMINNTYLSSYRLP